MEQSHTKKSEKHFWNAYIYELVKKYSLWIPGFYHVDNWNIKALRWHLFTYFNDAISNRGWNEFYLI